MCNSFSNIVDYSWKLKLTHSRNSYVCNTKKCTHLFILIKESDLVTLRGKRFKMQEFIQAQFVCLIYLTQRYDLSRTLRTYITKISVGYMSVNRLYLSVISSVIFRKVL